jgi:hypothetical protein
MGVTPKHRNKNKIDTKNFKRSLEGIIEEDESS